MEPALTADLFWLNAKSISDDFTPVSITALSESGAVILCSMELAALDNIRLHLYDDGSCLNTAQIYAKINSVDPAQKDEPPVSYLLTVDFTSVSPEAHKIISRMMVSG